MRFVHTADLHIGRKLAQMSLESDIEQVFRELADVVESSGAAALVVAGDVFDSPNPAESAVRQWDRFISVMAGKQVTVLVVSGNQDSGARLSMASDLIALSGIHIAGDLAAVLEPVVVADVNFWLVPFVRPTDVRAWARVEGIDAGDVGDYDSALRLLLDRVRLEPSFSLRPNVCVAHQLVVAGSVSPQRTDSEQLSLGTLDAVDVSVFDGFDYVALGHVHGPQRVGRNEVRYAGSPLKLSLSEADMHKSFVLVDVSRDSSGVRVTSELEPVVPARDVRKVHGSVEELVRRGREEDERLRGDFVYVKVTDDNPMDVAARLRNVWPNLVQVLFDNDYTRNAREVMRPGEVDLTKGMRDLFSEFFEQQMGMPLSEGEARLVDAAFEKVRQEGGDL